MREIRRRVIFTLEDGTRIRTVIKMSEEYRKVKMSFWKKSTDERDWGSVWIDIFHARRWAIRWWGVRIKEVEILPEQEGLF